MKKSNSIAVQKQIRNIDNWVFFLTKKQKRKLNTIRANNIEDYKTWSVYAVLLPLAAYLFAFLVNVLFMANHFHCWSFTDLWKEIFTTLNNGSLPIIGFGIVSSSISYLMEVIDEGNPSQKTNLAYLRRKIMSISVLILFLTSALYILQSINRNYIAISEQQETVVFIVTIIILILAISSGRKMFLLQKNTIQVDFAASVTKGRDNFTQGLDDKFGDDAA